MVSIIWLLIAILSTHARSIAINRHHFPDVSSKGALRGRATWNTCDWSTVEQSVEEAGEDLALCQKAFQTGTRLTCMMNPPTGFDSTYTEYAQLEDWGWSAASSKGVGIGFLNLNPVLNSLGSGTVTEPARWGSLSQTHSKAAKKGDYPATGAQYNNYVNLQEGIIVGYRNDGPVHVNNEKSEAQQIVSSRITKLRNFSDLFFLGLQKYASENSLDLSKIQHVIRYQITNEETINILQSIIGHEEPEDHKTVSEESVAAQEERTDIFAVD